MTGGFKFSVTDCDVEDKETLREYRQKRIQWVNWLEHDESHAILPLISKLVWNDVVFRFLARVAKQDTSSPLRNALLAESVIDGYFATQTLAIRRLMDRGPREDVISLRRLIADVRQHEYLLTRENYVSHDGLPYDCKEAERRVWRLREVAVHFGERRLALMLMSHLSARMSISIGLWERVPKLDLVRNVYLRLFWIAYQRGSTSRV